MVATYTLHVLDAQVRKFKAINTGGLAVGMSLDTKAMNRAGFSISPEELPLLAGAPTHGTVDIAVTLQVSR